MNLKLPLKTFFLILSAISILILSNSCKMHSEDFYTDKAVTRGRKLALNKMKFLTPNQRAYIEFNKPTE